MQEKPILKRPTPGKQDSVSAPAITNPQNVKLTLSNPRDLDRSRAEVAWNNINAVTAKSDTNYQKKYGSLARQMPTYIQVNGFAPTVAFLKAKGESHHTQMLKHLSKWFCHRFKWEECISVNWNEDKSNSTNDLLLERLLKMNIQEYRLATGEALSFLQWLKRFAEAEIEVDPNATTK